MMEIPSLIDFLIGNHFRSYINEGFTRRVFGITRDAIHNKEVLSDKWIDWNLYVYLVT